MLAARCWCWMLDTRCWMLDAGCWMLDAWCWMLDAGCWMLDARCWMLDARCSMLMLDARCWMLDAECSILNAGCPIICYYHGKSILIMFLRQQRNQPRRAQCNKWQHALNAINRNASTTFDSFLKHLYFPFYQDTFILRQQFCKGKDRNYRNNCCTLIYCSPLVFRSSIHEPFYQPYRSFGTPKTFSRHLMAFWFHCKALNGFFYFFARHWIAFWFLFKAYDGFLIPFQSIGWLSDSFSRHWIAFWFLSKALDGFLILFQGIE